MRRPVDGVRSPVSDRQFIAARLRETQVLVQFQIDHDRFASQASKSAQPTIGTARESVGRESPPIVFHRIIRPIFGLNEKFILRLLKIGETEGTIHDDLLAARNENQLKRDRLSDPVFGSSLFRANLKGHFLRPSLHHRGQSTEYCANQQPTNRCSNPHRTPPSPLHPKCAYGLLAGNTYQSLMLPAAR